MPPSQLAGHTVLILEDEPLIALSIANLFEDVGAEVLRASSLAYATTFLDTVPLSAAIVDFGLRDGNADAFLARLRAQGVPFVVHSGYIHPDGYAGGVVVPKPGSPDALLAAVRELIKGRVACPGST